MEDDISAEVLPSPGEIKIHLPLCYHIHQILYLQKCVKSTKKNPKQTRNQNNFSMLYPIKDSSYTATGEFQEPCLVASSKQLLVIFQKGHSF